MRIVGGWVGERERKRTEGREDLTTAGCCEDRRRCKPSVSRRMDGICGPSGKCVCVCYSYIYLLVVFVCTIYMRAC
jgi:hypothetical protein